MKSGQTFKKLWDAVLEKLKGSGLDAKAAARLHITALERPDTATLALPIQDDGFQIPYFDFDGRATGFFRFRYLPQHPSGFDRLTGHQAMRYGQPAGTINEVYMPPTMDWRALQRDATKQLFITEGELKAACGCQHGIPVMGLGGVDCFQAKKNDLTLLPQLAEITWQGREVYIVYDSDAVNNPNVARAERALARQLMSRGAVPKICRLPTLQAGQKTGLDDFLVARGQDAFLEVMQAAEAFGPYKILHDLNDEVLFIEDPGIVMRKQDQQRMKPSDFINSIYADWVYQEVGSTREGGTRVVEKSAPKEWIKWRGRDRVRRCTYKPGQDARVNDEANMWAGWPAEPIEGDVQPWHDIMAYVFREEHEDRRWFEQWCAYPLQRPGCKLATAVMMWSTRQGTGKSLIGETLLELYGKNGAEIQEAQLNASHNEWAECRQFIMGNEIVGGDKRGAADTLKQLITQREVWINRKYVPTYALPDCCNYYFTSNHPDAFYLEDSDRRFFIKEIKGFPKEPVFYDEYADWLRKKDGAAHLFHYLLNLSIASFNPRAAAPTTQDKRDMMLLSQGDLAVWVRALKRDPDDILRLGDMALPYSLMTADELRLVYDPERLHRVTSNGVARELKRAELDSMDVRIDNGTKKLYCVRNGEALLKTGQKELAEIYKKERAGMQGRKWK